MGGTFSNSTATYLHDIENISTEGAEKLLKVKFTASCGLDEHGEPVFTFNPVFRDGERRSNPFVKMKKELISEDKFISITSVHLVEIYNDLDIPFAFEIHKLFSTEPECKFRGFPSEEILRLGGHKQQKTAHDTGCLHIIVPAHADEIITSGVELYRSSASESMLLKYAGSDNLIVLREDIVFRAQPSSEVTTPSKPVPKEKGEEEDELEKEQGSTFVDDNIYSTIDVEDGMEMHSVHLDSPLSQPKETALNAPSAELPYSIYQPAHIFIKALKQFGPQLRHKPSHCRKLDNGCWQVPKYIERDIVNFMQMTFFKKRRYTMFSETFITLALKPDDREKVRGLLQEPQWANWNPQVSFTVWVNYVSVANENSCTHLHVVDLN